ncbi:hypothetical protein SLEP1_g38852 [Rubroshorea leprosula]|uniref:Uncharacterized protein n=1 Tax=Rubroshorea leprosula TaxID=152421 RepID=A0AAV5KYB7_9ROSI|nr:hypothetical protein SLEP1_g38852 [Rubroshorea leprosula]
MALPIEVTPSETLIYLHFYIFQKDQLELGALPLLEYYVLLKLISRIPYIMDFGNSWLCSVYIPIHRYMDLLAHYQVKAYLGGESPPFSAGQLEEEASI